MATTTQRLLLFGDQTVEKLPSIKHLVEVAKSSQTLRRFLREATDVVQVEVTKLSPDERKAFFAFDTLLTLAEENAKEPEPDEIVATTLMCIARLGECIVYAENDPSILGSSDSVVYILGLCTGMLPAAAATVAKDTSELLKYGLEIVAIAFRLAHDITLRSKRIEEAPGSWAYSIVGATAEESQAILDDFNSAQNLPIYRHAYVGVTSRTWTTIFGPPSVLAKLWTYSPELGLSPKLKLAVGAAVHAGQMPLLDIEEIIGHSRLLESPLPSKSRIVSTSTCKPFVAKTLRGLLREMILDITQNALLLTDAVQDIVSDLQGNGDIDLLVVGPTPHTGMVQAALQDANIRVNLTREAVMPSSEHNTRGGSNLIAIIGMSGRFPGSENIQEFWEVLSKGLDLHTKIPQSRFDIDAYFDPHGELKNSLSTQYGCFLDRPGLFDTRLFNVSPKEAAQMDPLQRLLLMVGYEALEMAGYYRNGSLATDSKRIATYIGQATDDHRAISLCQGIDRHYIPGVARAFYSSRLNYHFKWEGPSYNIDSACASSSTAVALACSALVARECDTALAGGGSILNAPDIYSGLSRGGFLSTTGGCKTFSESADGYCRGEGAGIVVLKRLEDAIADNDNIQAIIRGSARTYSAEAVSITQPHAETQRKLYRQVLQQACVDPVDIGYVEMHGTGTQAGDTTEMQSVADIFGERRTKDNPLVVGAVKANIGHGEAAAGISSLIKMLMMLRENAIPPQPGMPRELNHKFPPLKKMNIQIADEMKPFLAHSKGDGRRKMMLNNFDASGGNTCLILEEPPKRPQKGQDPRTHHVVTCSARTSNSLTENKKRLLHFVESHPKVRLSDLAYSTTARRLHDVFRSSYCTQTTSELAQIIASDVTESATPKINSGSGRTSVVFAFTGQGSMYAGMGKQLFPTCSRFRGSMFSYQKICDFLGLPSIVDIIANGETDTGRKTMVQVQLAIVSIELALADLWKSWGVQPDLLIGHSLGEYAALCVSGVLSVADTLNLVGKRSMLIQEKCTRDTYAMLAVGQSADSLEDVLETLSLASCQVSCLNAPSKTVVSGTIPDLERLQSHLQANLKTSTTFLKIPYGFHSAQVEPILADFEAGASGIQFAKPLIPIVSTLSGTIVNDSGTFSPNYLARQAREPVNYVGALQTCQASGLVNDQTLWMEIGPEPVCLGLIRSNLEIPSTRLLPSIKSSENNWKTISASIAAAYTFKVAINWPDFHKEYVNSLSLLELPTYAFDLKEYWAPFTQQPTVAKGSEPKSVSAPKTMLSTCLQYVEKESIQGEDISVIFSSHTSEPKLLEIIQGHLIDGTALCPASAFCDIAYTAAKYIHEKVKPSESVPPMSLWALEITHPLVVPAINPQQMIEVTAIKSTGADWSVNVSFASRERSSTHDHGGCQVRFDRANEFKTNSTRSLHLVKKRTDALVKSAMAGLSHRLLKPIIYKLFASLVVYDEKYQSLEEVFMDNEYTDAAATVKLRPVASSGNFTYSPYWIDAIVHLAGFLLNGNVTKPDEVIYISTGFEAFHVFEPLSEDATYTCYVCMQPSEEKKNIMEGDVYCFEGSRLVALCGGLQFQKMTKAILNHIMGVKPSKLAQSAVNHPKATVTKSATQAPAVTTRSKGHSESSSESESATNTPASSRCSVDGRDAPQAADQLLAAIATETGFDINDMEPSTLFSDMGVDSLMSIAIISTAQKRLGLELPASFFNEHPTVSDMRRELGKTSELDLEPDSPLVGPAKDLPDDPILPSEPFFPSKASLEDRKPMEEAKPKQEQTEIEAPVSKAPAVVEVTRELASNVVLVQGRSSSKEDPLFLITDGAGSATAYIHLPPFHKGNRIYALESPFLSDPSSYTCSIEEVALMYAAAIRRTQPWGPYIIGGWSAGAAYAYEVARQLLEQGEKILGLILIDMRVPRPMPDALEPTIELIEQAGLVTGINRAGQPMSVVSQERKQHLVSTVRALMVYHPQPMHPSRRPLHTFIIWARKGLSESADAPFQMQKIPETVVTVDEGTLEGNNMEDPETGLKSWFLAKRSAFGANGWDKLVGEVECHVMDGADHFSMVVPPHARTLGSLLKKAMEKSEALKT